MARPAARRIPRESPPRAQATIAPAPPPRESGRHPRRSPPWAGRRTTRHQPCSTCRDHPAFARPPPRRRAGMDRPRRGGSRRSGCREPEIVRAGGFLLEAGRTTSSPRSHPRGGRRDLDPRHRPPRRPRQRGGSAVRHTQPRPIRCRPRYLMVPRSSRTNASVVVSAPRAPATDGSGRGRLARESGPRPRGSSSRYLDVDQDVRTPRDATPSRPARIGHRGSADTWCSS